jgi:peptidoglycan/LPS O-acetylase OafA/YrhL
VVSQQGMSARPALRSAEPNAHPLSLKPESNAFGFLRLVLAGLVVWSHAYPLGGLGWDDWLATRSRGQIGLGELAVDAFLVISGFLCTRSALATPSALQFLWRRALRIVPAYWGCLAVTAFVFAPLWNRLEHGDSDWFGAVRAGLSFAEANAGVHIRAERIPGILNTPPFTERINGALWTIEYESGCYIGLALLCWLGLVSRRRRAVIPGLLGLFGLAHVLERAQPGLGSSLLGGAFDHSAIRLATFFVVGSTAYLYRDELPCGHRIGGAACALLALTAWKGGFQVVAPAALGVAVPWLAASLPLRGWDRRVDLSYGLYLYAFLFEQTLAAIGLHKNGLSIYVPATLLLTLPVAWLSWRLVEKPAVRLKSLPTRIAAAPSRRRAS